MLRYYDGKYWRLSVCLYTLSSWLYASSSRLLILSMWLSPWLLSSLCFCDLPISCDLLWQTTRGTEKQDVASIQCDFYWYTKIPWFSIPLGNKCIFLFPIRYHFTEHYKLRLIKSCNGVYQNIFFHIYIKPIHLLFQSTIKWAICEELEFKQSKNNIEEQSY